MLRAMSALLFIGTWVLLALGVFLIAVSGGPGAARERVLHTQSRRGRRVTAAVVTAIFVGMGIAVPTLVIAGNDQDKDAGAARIELTAAEQRGREIFGQRCNQCHVLAAADTAGRTGPDLDKLKPPRSLVLDAVLKGRARGIGRMPAQIVQGRDAEDVAAFVARVAGTE